MITMKESKLLLEKIEEGIELANRYKQPIVVSITTAIDKQDALAFFQAFKYEQRYFC